MEQNFESNIVCGLGNLGNTCFANSALQALTASQPFIAALRYGVADDVSPPPASSASSPTSPPPAHAADFSATSAAATAFERFKFLTRYSTARHEVRKELIRTVNAMQFGSDLVIAPRGMIRNVAAINEQFAVLGQQQDAAEWLHSVVDSVDECCSVDGQARETLTSLEASSVPSSSALPDPRLWLWRALASIDEENEELDRIEKERKHRDDRVGPASPWIAPRHHRGPIGDVFRGLYVSSIECLTCHRASRVATEFTALELAIPPDEARKQYADLMALNPPASSGSRPQSPVTEPKSKSRAVSLNPIVAARAAIGGCLSVVARSMRWLWCCVGGGCCQDFPPLTLEELLWFHCRPEDLTGSNKYHCSYCGGKPRDAVKTIKFLALPETLVVHIKRFEVGSYWTSKLRDHVRFPLDFVPAAAADGASAAVVTSDGETPPLDMKSVLYHGGPLVTSYTLNAVVNHHGSFMGGHYTAYSLRGGNWVLHNDAKAMRVDAKVVADSQAYVLVYQRQALTVNDAASVVPPQHRLAAQRYLHHGYSAQASTTDSQDSVLVSRMWLLRLATFAEPGPITNSMCYCPASRRQNHCTVFGGDVSDALMPPVEHGDRSNRHFHCPAEWFYTRVSAADFDAWQRHYGGGPRVDDRAYLQCWQHETRWIGAIQRALQLGHRGSS